MKKWIYLFFGFIIGAVVVASVDTVIAQVKSMVGQKVTGEYKVIVNGKELQDKGAVISGKTNAPVRAISESIGADLKVDNKTKTIMITTEDASDLPSSSKGNEDNELQTSVLLIQKSSLEKEVDRLKNEKTIHEGKYASAEDGFGKDIFKQALDDIDKQLAEKTQELNKIKAELAALEK